MQLKVIGTGSSGNCYLVQANGRTIVLDAGMPLKAVKEANDWRIDNIDGLFVTHAHGDHDGYTVQYLLSGIRSNDEAFKYQEFELNHGNEECVGFLIEWQGLKIVYATDCVNIPYKFNDVDLWLIEANWSEELVGEQHKDWRTIQTHHSLENCIDFFNRQEIKSDARIVLCHLSETNANNELFRAKFTKQVGFVPHIAENGQTIKLNNKK